MLRLDSISKQVGVATHLFPMNLELRPGSINVLLGATLAGKTSLLRIIAGLDHPSSGRVFAGGSDVTDVPVRRRNLAMVYQQFINYPSFSVYENIASPLKLQRRAPNEIKRRVGEIAETLRLTPFLDRLPAELSGGQQQRTALARALAKDAELLLLDEPLVNLDYKLREELRSELAQLFGAGKTTVVYATTEPQEALQLGGHTAILDEGRLLQFAPTIDAFLRPVSLNAARAFSDPPMNLLDPRALLATDPRTEIIGVRPHHLRIVRENAGDVCISGRVELAEKSGSDTYLHVGGLNPSTRCDALVAQLRGVHEFAIGAPCAVFFNPACSYAFDAQGALLFAPEAD
jgi:glycerol transport system ATP-binding protein